MIVFENGSKILDAEMAWHHYCLENDIIDPWEWIDACEKQVNKQWETIDDKRHKIFHFDIVPLEEWPNELREEYKLAKTYRDQYMCDREVWKGQYILDNYGYNALIFFAQTHSQEETALKCDKAFWKWFEQVEPCDGQEEQCSMFCLKFLECSYRNEAEITQ